MSQPFPVSSGDTDRSVPTKVKLLIYSQVLNNFAFGYFLIYLTAYLVESGVFDAYQVGVILGLETVIVIVAGIPIGILSDRKGRKKFLIFGNALIPAVLLIVSSTYDFDWFLLAAVLLGLAESSSLGSWNAIIADQTHLGNRDSAFSRSFVVSNLFLSGGFAIPLALPSLQEAFGLTAAQIHSGLFFWFGIFSIPVPLVIWMLLRGYHERSRALQEPERPGELKLLLKFSALNGIIGLGAGLIIPLLGSWFYYKFAVPDTFSGPFIALSNITIAFAAVASPRLSKKYGLFNSILLTAGSSTLFMFGMAFVPTVAIAGAVYLVRAALMNMASPLLDSYLMGIVHSGRRGLGSAISAIVWRLPNSVTTVVGGFLLYTGYVAGNHFLYDLPWILAAGLYVVGIGLLYYSFRNVKPRG
ncbi:MAG: MFS transporter [Nitrososphaerota archaeon]|nr:MFS transporter [Nitrososphaerota archaeon]MDG7024553.1 MFS transporter [Nitrososphaerota archaeon]